MTSKDNHFEGFCTNKPIDSQKIVGYDIHPLLQIIVAL